MGKKEENELSKLEALTMEYEALAAMFIGAEYTEERRISESVRARIYAEIEIDRNRKEAYTNMAAATTSKATAAACRRSADEIGKKKYLPTGEEKAAFLEARANHKENIRRMLQIAAEAREVEKSMTEKAAALRARINPEMLSLREQDARRIDALFDGKPIPYAEKRESGAAVVRVVNGREFPA